MGRNSELGSFGSSRTARIFLKEGFQIMQTVSLIGFLLITVSLRALAGDINGADLRPGNTLGRLGKHFGERQVISGAPTNGIMIPNPLAVLEANGKTLENPVILEVQGHQLHPGAHYKFEGYESGGFRSVPEWVAPPRKSPTGGYIDPGPQQPFQFYEFFIVTKVLEPAGE